MGAYRRRRGGLCPRRRIARRLYFYLLVQPWDAHAFRSSTQRGLAALNAISSQDTAAQRAGVLAWTLNNHDAHRAVSRYGLIAENGSGTAGVMGPQLRRRGEVDVRLGRARARAALLFLLALPGSIYLYQGEELGLPEVLDLPDDARRDPIWNRSGGTEHGRDGSCVPLPWRSEHPTFGFSPDTAREAPWLPQPAYFGDLAADVQAKDSSSALSLYRAALSARRLLIADLTPQVRWLPMIQGREDVVAYTRGNVTVVTIFGSAPFELPAAWGEIVLASAARNGRSLAGPGLSVAEPVGPGGERIAAALTRISWLLRARSLGAVGPDTPVPGLCAVWAPAFLRNNRPRSLARDLSDYGQS